MNNRRKFIKLGAFVAAGAFVPLQFCTSPRRESEDLEESVAESVKGTLSDFGIQLYSVKEDMAVDARSTIEKIASYGYTQIEGFDGGKGIFWGMDNKEFKSFTGDLGLDFVASHCNVFQNTAQLAEEAAAINMKYLISPWIGPQKSIDEYKKQADRFNEAGKICKDAGIRFAYHNHGYTFEELEGKIPHDVLLENTDPDLVDFELDIFWAINVGADPKAYFEKYKNRFKLGHVKDREHGTPLGKGDASTVLGTGDIDYPSVLRSAKDNGMEYFIVEQEKFEGTNPLDAAQKNAEFMKNLSF
ncbi:sugar phosphate isomerase/epimerase family protein [Pararhodonellum marinum]|uniref:sugar phosphate isomerase/epimerase family protein n=1 Tax=Pararhodonellum marinum TaxID=2755358 RepID=UPI00188DE767|nr:sugar phosphate isomerase/epimerase [Pararhodonellum marinum]